MKKNVVAIIILLVLVVGAAGGYLLYNFFKGSEKHLQLVPKNAMFVATVDFKSLILKSEPTKIQQLNWYKDFQKKTAEKSQSDPQTKSIMDAFNNPLSCGVNLMSDVYVFACNTGNAAVAGGLIFDIKDADAFEKTVKKISPDIKITSTGNYKWVQQNDVALAWNKTGAIVAGVQDKNGTTKLSDFLDVTFSRKLNESILANEQFEKFNLSRKDVSVFINMAELYAAIGNFNPTAMMSLSSTPTKDMYAWGNIDFQKNKVLGTMHVDMPAATASTMNVLSKSGLSDEHLKDITPKDCYMLMSFSCDADKMFANYEANPSMKTSLDQMAMMTGMSTKDLESIFGGEFSAALVDFKKLNMPAPVNNPNDPSAAMIQAQLAAIPLPVVTINFSSKNKDGVQKLLEGKIPLTQDGYYHMNLYGYVDLNLVPNKFGYTLTNDQDIAKKIAGGGNVGSLPDKVNDLAKNNPALFYMNLDLNTYPQPLRDMASAALGKNYQAFAAYMAMFKDVIAKGNQQDSEVALNLTQGDDNSLYRFFAQADESYKIVKQ